MDTLSQRMARAAFPAVKARREDGRCNFKEYTTFAKKFPSLIHTCGLAQAIAFAQAKKEDDYLADLAAVLQGAHAGATKTVEDLAHRSRTETLSGYLRLSRNALLAAGWIKRYVEAFNEKEDASPEDQR
ncbi:MAG: type III-B CRISPR module-associated protein Cmr5 [Gemmataceae bacterium]|nr:type III-B CRISPR module-associated protein Cmr5 [Gemmata sp.]MDW8199064.1 type III-B CRISPR module-associated protein Cmr5 [Gemmataceae bacterium]